jgi:tripartite-type tricarboxylate transporter receptor subunit TctC
VQYVQKDVPYNTLRDFAPIGLVAVGPYLFAAHPTVPARNVGELIGLAKSEPGKLTYGSSGNGSTNHLAMELFKSMTGVNIRHVPYKGGSQATTELVGGHVHVSMLSIGSLLSHVKAQRLKVLAVTSIKRWPQLPQVPTLDESGLKGFEAIRWFGMLAPAGTPKAVVTRVAAGLQKVMRQPETRAQFERQGAEPANGDPSAFARLLQREIERYGKLAKISGIKAD